MGQVVVKQARKQLLSGLFGFWCNQIMPARLKKKILCWFVFITIPIILFAAVKIARWHNDPHIREAERAARKKLGLQIYGAFDCGVVDFGSHVDHPFKSPLFGDTNREVIRKVTNQYKNRKPFIYVVKYWSDKYGAARYTASKVIIGTRSGEVHEFRQTDTFGYVEESDMNTSYHRKWEKPTIEKKSGAPWFFDAGQKPK